MNKKRDICPGETMILETDGHWIGIFGARVDHLHDIEGLVKSLSKLGAPYKSEAQMI